MADALPLELFPAPAAEPGQLGKVPRCQEPACKRYGIGPGTPWCYKHWTPERDPEGAALWEAIRRRLDLPTEDEA